MYMYMFILFVCSFVCLFVCLLAGMHSVPGGVFPTPPAAAHLMTMMPPPSCFQVHNSFKVYHTN